SDNLYLGINDKANNSDKLDGLHASSFALSNHDHSGEYLEAGGGTLLTSTTDLNNVKTQGTYHWGADEPNNPFGDYGTLFVFEDQNQPYQLLVGGTSAGIATRRANSGSYGSWVISSVEGHNHDDRYVRNSGDTINGNLVLDNGASSSLNVICDDSG
ncbi:pyocin knob domain-containing protein, partial [Pseudoalteromonas sp. GABNS16H]|uniref:pyocin knob domain-containing protein n=1 Tax=Pseudoalteromonas sp. GABNS16H TaxID=3025325 RepID=UPI0023610CC7